MQVQADATNLEANVTPMPAGMENCASCDLCIPLAELAGATLAIVAFAFHEKPLMGCVDFMSASAAQVLKPPIS